MILSRAVLGIAGATIAPSVLASITNMFRDEAQRGVAISIWMVCFMGGMAIGPLVGGALLESFEWGAVFLLGVPAMVLLLVTGPFLLPEHKSPTSGRLDLPSVGLSLATILPAIWGLKELAKHGLGAAPLLAMAIGLGVGLVFVRRQQRLAEPLLDLALFRNRRFMTAVAAMFGITLTGAMMLFTSQYLQLVVGLSPLEAGLWTVPGVVAMVVSLLASPILARRVPPARLISWGLVVSLPGAVMMTQLDAGSGVAPVALAFALLQAGCAPLVTLGNGIIMTSVVPEKAGSAAAISETCAELGFALGIAILGSVFTAIYRGVLVGEDLPTAVVDSLASATVAGAGEATLAMAKDAFVDGLQVLAIVCTAILAAVALLGSAPCRRSERTTPTPRRSARANMPAMRLAAFSLALATSAAACGPNKQLSNRQVAVGVVTAAAIVGLIILLSTADCNELTDACD